MTDHIHLDSHGVSDECAATLTAPWRGLSPAVWILVTARAVNRIGAFTLPFLGVVLTVEFGASLSQTGLILALFGAATIPSRLLGGQLADRLGRRRTIVLGLTGCAVAQTWIASRAMHSGPPYSPPCCSASPSRSMSRPARR